MKKNIFAGIEETVKALAERLSTDIGNILENRNEVYLAISGGSTPKKLFEVLANDYKTLIIWDKVHIFWVDERMVDPENDESNFRMTRESLFKNIDMPDKNIHRVKGEMSVMEEVNRYACKIKSYLPEHNKLPQFDIILLGMGDDGHTASIFPHELELYHSQNITEIGTHPHSGQKRITLSGKVINNAKKVYFLITGANKADKIKQIFEQKDGYEHLPASHVHPEQGQLEWFMDKAAASKIAI